MTGKTKCKLLKEIRLRIAEMNGIDYKPAECTHEGDCSGHCPVCDSEANRLMDALRAIEDGGGEIKIHANLLSLLDNAARSHHTDEIEPIWSTTGALIAPHTEEQPDELPDESDVIRMPGLILPDYLSGDMEIDTSSYDDWD